MTEQNPNQHAAEDEHPPALRELRRHRRGTLRADDRPFEVKFILDGQTGAPVVPLNRDAIEAEELVLFVPDDRFGALELLSDRRDPEEREEELRDRYLAYHRRVDPGVYTLLDIAAAKMETGVWDGEAVARPNALEKAEPKLCRIMNADRPALAALCLALAKIEIAEPLCVGVDDLGADIRTAVEVIRLEWPKPLRTPEEAEAMITALLRASDGDLAL